MTDPFFSGGPLDSETIRQIADAVGTELLKDLAKSLAATEAQAEKLSTPWGTKERMEVTVGFATACARAGARALSDVGLSYLHWLALSACVAAHTRILSEGEENLHQFIHQLLNMFPQGAVPGMTFLQGDPQIVPSQPIKTEDLN